RNAVMGVSSGSIRDVWKSGGPPKLPSPLLRRNKILAWVSRLRDQVPQIESKMTACFDFAVRDDTTRPCRFFPRRATITSVVQPMRARTRRGYARRGRDV